jgi:hypothetical protein
VRTTPTPVFRYRGFIRVSRCIGLPRNIRTTSPAEFPMAMFSPAHRFRGAHEKRPPALEWAKYPRLAMSTEWFRAARVTQPRERRAARPLATRWTLIIFVMVRSAWRLKTLPGARHRPSLLLACADAGMQAPASTRASESRRRPRVLTNTLLGAFSEAHELGTGSPPERGGP